MTRRPTVLREPDFRRLFVADVFSQLSAHIILLALPLTAVLTLDAGELEVGVLSALGTVAFLALGLPAGAWVDRMRRRHVLVVGDVGRALLLATIPLAWWAGILTIWQLYVVAFLCGVLTVFFDVAYQSYLPHLVGRDRIVEGNSILEAVRAVSQMGAPTLAGGLVQWLTAPLALAANAFTFAGSAVFVGLIRKREERPVRAPDSRLRREIAEGLRFVLGNRLLRSIALCTGSFNLCMAMVTALEMVFLVRDVGVPPGQIGVFFSVGAVGGLVGAVLVKHVVRWWGQGPTIWRSVALTTPFVLLLPWAEPGVRLWLAAAGFAVGNMGGVVYNITQVSFRQAVTPERLLGRMNATIRFLVWGTLPLGALIGGVLGEQLGARTTIGVAAVASCLTFLPVFFSPLRRMRELPAAPEDDPDERTAPSLP